MFRGQASVGGERVQSTDKKAETTHSTSHHSVALCGGTDRGTLTTSEAGPLGGRALAYLAERNVSICHLALRTFIAFSEVSAVRMRGKVRFLNVEFAGCVLCERLMSGGEGALRSLSLERSGSVVVSSLVPACPRISGVKDTLGDTPLLCGSEIYLLRQKKQIEDNPQSAAQPGRGQKIHVSLSDKGIVVEAAGQHLRLRNAVNRFLPA